MAVFGHLAQTCLTRKTVSFKQPVVSRTDVTCDSAESSNKFGNGKGVDSCIAKSHNVVNNGNAESGILKEVVDCFQNDDESIEGSQNSRITE